MPDVLGWLLAVFDVILIVALAGIAIYFYTKLQAALRRNIAAESEAAERLTHARGEAARILEEPRPRQKELILEAKDEQIRLRSTLEAEHREQRAEIQRLEARVRQKEEQFD